MKTFLISSIPYHIIMRSGLLVLLLFLIKTVYGGTIVKNLPGYEGDLPFTLETGYVGVGENEQVKLFYYFVESQSSPSEDPLMLWISGGPGCSSLTALFFENGPLTMDVMNFDGGLPKLVSNPYAWTKNLSIIFLDAPVGTGFSYAETSEGYSASDSILGQQAYEFLQEWFKGHTQFSRNELYVAGDGYSGNPVTIIIEKILNGGSEPTMNVKGFVLGNPGTDRVIDFNARTTAKFRLALIPEDLYIAAYISCGGNFTTENPSEQCAAYNAAFFQLTRNVNPTNILQPACNSGVPAPSAENLARRSLEETESDDDSYKHCSAYTQMVCERWANDEEVQVALNIAQGTVNSWAYCNNSLNSNFVRDIPSVLDYHRNFTKTNIQGLIYSGDHDTGIPYMGTEKWISTLNLTIDEQWRPWLVASETAGYTRRYTNNAAYNLTFTTVMGAGHFAAADKMKECSVLVNKWLANISL